MSNVFLYLAIVAYYSFSIQYVFSTMREDMQDESAAIIAILTGWFLMPSLLAKDLYRFLKQCDKHHEEKIHHRID